MKESYAKTKSVVVPTAVLAAFSFFATARTAIAQGGGSRGTPPTSVERRQELSNRQATEYELENSRRDLKGRPESAAGRKHVQEIGTQIKHDFEGLQQSYNELVIFMSHKDGITSQRESVMREVAEIRKCSTRLKTNLALPKLPRDKFPVEGNTEMLEESLLSLRKHIYDFATNPLFESLNVLDIEQGRKAARDLDRIIELSDSISKSDGAAKHPD